LRHSRLVITRWAPFAAAVGVALSLAGVAEAQSQSAAAQPASGGGAASLVATLTPVGRFAGFTTLAASSSIVAAGGDGPNSKVTDVFTEPSGGWQGSGPAASLVDPAVSGEPTGLSVSRDTVVEGSQSAVAVPGVEDVFVKPVSGWSGAVTPAATLAPSTPGQAVSHAVIAGSVIAGDVTPATRAAQRLEGVVVYVKPATGWSGQVRSRARLAVPRGARIGGDIAITSRTIFVSTATRTYAFNKPVRGWSGTINPTAQLQAIGSISTSGSTIVVSGKIFTKPRHGWVGIVAPVARVISPSGGVGQTSSPTTVATASVGRIPPGGCVSLCTATVAAVSKPTHGWSGTLHARTIVHTSTGTSLLPIAVSGQNLYVTGGGSIDAYQLAGRSGAMS
jgi:hypothetical protein